MKAPIIINGLLAAALYATSLYLALQNELKLQHSTLHFTGLSLYLLAGGCFALASFAEAIARGWSNGTLPLPRPDRLPLMADPQVKGTIWQTLWYWPVSAIIMITAALLLV